MFDWTTYKSQGIQSVDMCAAVILSHRRQRLPIKAIHLLPMMYEQFKSWAQKNLGREMEPGEKMQFDEVNIEKGDARQSTPLLVEMYAHEPKMGIA